MSNKQVWRLIPFLEASGNLQMAIDKWLLEQHHLRKHPPTLRFYTWSPAAISLGYHQRQYPQAWENLTWQGKKLDLVRRPTGGRAVLHQGDLTYAVITSGLTGNRLQAYTKICEFLIQGWRSLGVELSYGTSGRGYIHNPNCFGTATGADLILPNGAKLIGSAQLKRGNVILQHGSIRLQPDAELFAEVFGTESFNNLHFPYSHEQIITALIAAAQDCFDMEIEVQPFSQLEREEIMAFNLGI
ncbi:biotin/lipoate A/B protein ligase family protein [Nostoc sp. FACHB-280]|uniref:lipoate--protein ligase family protein n=1 Tax=Nostoc sp. FACHB-280 TaxID=2692839 RepID=UPI00168A776A|nr:biotin/lipoate A/B protein ligase family protein [Nostoc sp. FACHB-280]MBD2493667.1 lipoate--protein ligase family protein [Nostoc sp. FACHB-280]